MKTSSFHIVPLATEIADEARRAVNAGAADHALITVDSPGSSPCRHCLRWAQLGERVILFPYAAIPSGNPYSETGPIKPNAPGSRCPRTAWKRALWDLSDGVPNRRSAIQK